jgi:hypothetical protein
MSVGIYYFYHGFGLKAFEGRHIRISDLNQFLYHSSYNIILFYFHSFIVSIIFQVSDLSCFIRSVVFRLRM